MDTTPYIGTPYADRGRGWDGCDCYGLIWLVYAREYGIALPSLSEDYASSRERDEIAGLMGEGRPLWAEQVEEPREGDVVMLRRKGQPKGHAGHLGLVIEPGRMLHIHSGIDAAIERYDSSLWLNRIEGYLRWAG